MSKLTVLHHNLRNRMTKYLILNIASTEYCHNFELDELKNIYTVEKNGLDLIFFDYLSTDLE